MAQLTKAAFLSKWATLFADNSSREIGEEDMRDFRQDIADSFLAFDTTTYAPFVLIGNVDLSGDALPTTGGSGIGGTIVKGNSFRVSVGTTSGIGGTLFIDPNTEIIALQDNPTLPAHWWIRI